VEQREDDGRHESRLSENICNLNRRNAYGVFDSHSTCAAAITPVRSTATKAKPNDKSCQS